MRPSFRLAVRAVLPSVVPVVVLLWIVLLLGLAAPASAAPEANLAADCKRFFDAASKPPMAMPMRMRGMQMLDTASGPLPLVCLTVNDPFRPPLFEGIGTPTIKVSDDAVIQRYFDQGLRFYMGFNNRESYRAFRYAAETAAKTPVPCAWCYWGAAVPLGTDINMSTELELDRVAANDYLAKARALEPKGLLSELIDATAKRSVDCDKSPQECRDLRSSGYYDAMSGLLQKYPNDPNIGVLYVDSILNLTPWQLPAKDKFLAARDTLERLMPANPSHNGLIHWYIHLMELSTEAGRAEERASKLAALAPKAGHLVHMPSHIYYRIGDMRRARDSNVAASAADETYFKDPRNQLEHPDGDRYRYGYYPHTLHFLAAATTLLGDKNALNDATTRLYATPPPDPEGYRKDKYREVYYLARVNLATPTEIRAFVKPDGASNVQPRGNAAYWYTQVMADLWEGKPPTSSLPKFETALNDYPGIDKHDPNESCRKSIATDGDTGLCVVALENDLVRGRLSASKGEWSNALSWTYEAGVLQTALAYDEPPDWLYSLHQSHAAMLIRKAVAQGASSAGSQAALQQAKTELLSSLDTRTNRSDVFPGSGWAYYGLWQVARYLKGDDPAKAEKAFRAHWVGPVDPTLDRM